MSYHVLQDYEDLNLRSKEVFKFACCDCGLVHRVCIVIRGPRSVQMALVREKRATAAKRAAMRRAKAGIFKC